MIFVMKIFVEQSWKSNWKFFYWLCPIVLRTCSISKADYQFFSLMPFLLYHMRLIIRLFTFWVFCIIIRFRQREHLHRHWLWIVYQGKSKDHCSILYWQHNVWSWLRSRNLWQFTGCSWRHEKLAFIFFRKAE